MANNNNGSNNATENQAKTAENQAKASAKQTSQNAQNAPKQGKKNKGGLIAYLRGVRQEFRKVVWPTREELTTDTVVVVVCVLFFAVTFWLIDTGFLAALKGILGITLS
ncbi:MAG: preprotein translocase subunit SecE [Mogibacterium sp.]|nr:preprotein translocase subunit SecE [Mogibacterium sp.]